MAGDRDCKFALNGLSIDTMSINQSGELEIEFDLAHPQLTNQYRADLKASRTFDVYEDPELEEACMRLFQLVRQRVRDPDPEMEQLHCDDDPSEKTYDDDVR